MTDVLFYKDSRGMEPAAEWIADPKNGNTRASIDTKIIRLLTDWQVMLQSGILTVIEPREKGQEKVPGFYELKGQGGKWRLAVYHNLKKNCFVLLCGWHKSQRSQPRDINRAYALLYEYLSREDKSNEVSYRGY